MAMVKQSDAFDRAAECERLMNSETDLARKAAYQSLRDMWIELANECASMSPEEFAKHFADIEQIQAGFQEATKKG
jgi:hypothetical protein